MKKSIAFILTAVMMFVACPASAEKTNLKMEYNLGGAEGPHYVAESYYAQPVVKDINKDGKKEIIFGNYSVSVLDAATGKLVWKVNGGKGRSTAYKIGQDIGILCDIAVADIDSDGMDEIVCAHAKGVVSVLNHEGYMEPGWPVQLTGENGAVYASARSLEVCDLDNDSVYEIIIGASTQSAENVWVYDAYGKLLPGWPQLESGQNAALTQDIKSGFSFGVFMDGVTAGDITGDGIKEVIVATDTAYICAYDMHGNLVDANSRIFKGRTWGKVALWEDEDTEQDTTFNEGWGWQITGDESRSELYKGELGHAVVKVCDVDNNGENEVVTSAIIIDRDENLNRATGSYDSSKYMSVFIFNGDRTRFKTWRNAPSDKTGMGKPLCQDAASLASGVQAEPVVCDLNNDGVNEVLINTYDGCVHAFSVNDSSKEFGKFPFKIKQTNGVFETAGGVVCKDINGDGKMEVIFATSTDDASHSRVQPRKGSVYVLDSNGNLITSAILPDGYTIYETKLPAYTNCAWAKVCVDDTDGDGRFEIVVNTRFSGICVFEIEGSTTAVTAVPTSSKVIVNGESVAVSSYNINGYNYFKLRDVAQMVNGTKKQFNVGYNNATKAVEIIVGEPYSAVGGELSVTKGEVKTAYVSTSSVYNKNALATYVPYMIDGNNYFKLRDVCNMVGIEVGYEAATNSIVINSR